MKKFNQIILAAGLFSLSGVASAVLIEGTIKFGGDVDFDFVTDSVDILGDDAIVVAPPTLDFAAFAAAGDTAIYNDFNYNPLSVSGGGELWSINGLSFTLTEIVFVSETNDGNTDFLDVAGNGIFSAAGFDDTEGFWSFSTDGLSSDFTFSSTNVPEPGVALLLGAGLVGFGVSRKLRKTA